MNAELTTQDKLAVLVDDCLDGPGDPAMIAPLLKAAAVLNPNDEIRRSDETPTST